MKTEQRSRHNMCKENPNANTSAEKWADWIDVRLDELDNQYESQHTTDIDKAILEKIRRQLGQVLGTQHMDLLHAYTDRLIAIYNRDGDWFYKKGWQDAMQVIQDSPSGWLDEP
ncbi:hypothetical protein [Ethanoligenens harbinense]|nr:hypothetical protein [Ethanoligenens harbinense]